MSSHTLLRRTTAYVLSCVVAVNSMLWAAPPQQRVAVPPPSPTPYSFEKPQIQQLAEAFEELLQNEQTDPGDVDEESLWEELGAVVSELSAALPSAQDPAFTGSRSVETPAASPTAPQLVAASKPWEPVFFEPTTSRVVTGAGSAAPVTTIQPVVVEPDPDINDDGVVNIFDVSLASSCYQWDFETLDVCPCLKADTDGDWDIDFDDLNFVISGFSQTGFPTNDTVPPHIRASRDVEPNTSGWNNTAVTVSFECYDCGSGVAVCPADVIVESDGGDQNAEGTATDQAGNASTASLSVSMDRSPPDTSVLEPAIDTSSTSPNVRVRYADPTSGVNVATLSVTLDGVDITSALVVGGDEAAGPAPTPLTLGEHELVVTIEDVAGNVGTTTHGFVVSAGLPLAVAIDSPQPNSYHAQSPVEVRGTLTGAPPDVVVQCEVDGTTTLGTVTGDSFVCDAGLQEGANALHVTATTPAGGEASADTVLILDTIPPAVTLITPAAPHYTNVSSVDVSGGVVDASPVTVRIEGPTSVDANVTGASFSAAGVSLGVLTNGGQLQLRAVAEDAAGNIGEDSVDIFVDLEPPDVELQQPVAGSIVRSPFQVSGTVMDTSPVVMVDVNGEPVVVDAGRFDTMVTATDGQLPLQATAHDAAGNMGSTSIAVTVDSTPPVIDVSTPLDGAVTAVTPIRLEGSIIDATAVSLTVNGVPVGPGFPADVDLTEGPNALVLEATDAAGNQSTTTLNVTLDTMPPTLDVVGPVQNEVLAELPVLVQGTVLDATPTEVTVNGVPAMRMQDAWQLPVTPLPEGENHFEVVAIDAAGNTTTVSRDVFLDLTAPLVTISSPATGTLTNASEVLVTGTVVDATDVTVTVNGIDAPVDGGGGFASASGVPLADGDNTIRAVATDQGGRSGEASVLVTQDAVPPVITLTTPETVSRISSGQVLAGVTDNIGVAEVEILVDGIVQGTFQSGPYEISLVASDTHVPGDTITVTVNATDLAGNTATFSRGVQVIADGIIVGQVLADGTSLPLEGAVVELGQRMVTTDARGRYSIPTGDAEVILHVGHDGMTSVERRLSVAADVGTVPVDARLTTLGPETVLATDGALGGGLDTPLGPVSLSLQVPAFALSGPTAMRLTPLSAQALPALLPLGWSPLASWDLRSAPALIGPMEMTLSGLPVVGDAHLVQYDASLHEWLMVEASLPVVADELTVSIPASGTYALIAGDAGRAELVVPGVGEVLSGVEMELISELVTSQGVVDPPVLPPAGGIAAGTLSVFSPETLPSGTVVQAEITETFTLASGAVASEQTRLEDIVLFQVPAEDGVSLAAKFAISSSRTFGAAELVEGKVHLDILAGREGVRGERGGNRALTLEEGDVRITVPSQSLAEDTAIALRPQTDLSSFVPVEPGLEALGEVDVDLSGQTLAFSAQLSLGNSGVPDGSTLFVARVDRLNGVPHLTVVAMARLEGDRVVSQTVPGLAGVRDGGRYVFYRAANPVGFVAGTASSASGPVKAVVQTDGLPFLAVAQFNGDYKVAALVGTTSVRATVPGTSLATSETVVVSEGQTTDVDLTLLGTVTTATVTPADGTLGVRVTDQLEIATTSPVDGAGVTADNIKLFEGAPADNQLVPLRFVVSGSGRTIAVIPEAALKFSTEHTLQASGLTDAFGGAVTAVSSTFMTRDESAPVLATEQLVLSMPDDNGVVEVSAPAGTFPPGSSLLIVNAGNGVVVTFTADNDGAVLGDFPASIRDRILITITDPSGNVTSIERSKFVAPDGTTGIGPGGGTVEGEGGVQLRVPEGAVPQGVTLKIEAFDETELEPDERPVLDDASFGGGLKVTSPEMPFFKKEVDLAFPKPVDAPDGAFFYVYRKIEGPGGVTLWQTIDQAFVEGDGDDAKVVTASFPFSGVVDSFSSLSFGSALSSAVDNFYIMMWNIDELTPGKALAGLITGRVLRTVPRAGAPPDLVGVPNVPVTGTDAAGIPLTFGENETVAITQGDGTFSFWDNRFQGGTYEVVATVPDGQGGVQEYKATAFSIDIANTKTPGLQFYQNVATANITLPALAPVPEPLPIEILVMKEQDGTREITDGIVVEGTPLLIGFRTPDTVTSATINGETFSVRTDTAQTNVSVDYLLDQTFTPPQAGSYRVEVTAIPAFGPPVESSLAFRAIAAGGSIENLPTSPPEVITARVVPRINAKGVPPSVFPQVTFTEPVKNIPNNVQLIDSTGQQVGFVLSGVNTNNDVVEVNDANVEVTSLTIQPLSGLKFGTSYVLTLSSGIEDLDRDLNSNPAPKSLVPFETTFKTFGPESLGGTEERFGSAGIAFMDDRAFLVENLFSSGILRVFDVTDPLEPVEIPSAQNVVTGRPVDIVAADDLVVIATSSTNRSLPSNVWIFDVADRNTSTWVGAASLTSNAVEGFVQRIELSGGLAYALTGRRGLQIVDLGKARSNFDEATGGELFSSGYWKMLREFGTSGQGFGQSAVTQPIPLAKPTGGDWFQTDLAVGNIQGDVEVVVTGEAPLILVNPSNRTASQSFPVEGPDGSTLTTGSVVALGQIAGRDIAVLAGWGSVGGEPPGPVVAIVDLSDLQNPFTLSVISIPLDATPTDILIDGDLAIVAGLTEAALVNIGDPEQPRYAGSVEMAGGVLALTDEKFLLSTERSRFGGETALGGIKTAALQRTLFIEKIEPAIVPVDVDGRSTEPIRVTYRLIGEPVGETAGSLTLNRNDVALHELRTPVFSEGRVTLEVPAGVALEPPAGVVTVGLVEPDGSDGASTRMRISNPGGFEQQRALALTPRHESLTPRSAQAGQGGLTITETGENLAIDYTVYDREPSGAWAERTPTFLDTTSVRFELPSTLTSQGGFLQVAIDQKESESLAFLVAHSELPQPGSSTEILITAVDESELGPGGGALLITGSGFADGMSVVLGRGSAGVALPGLAESDEIEVYLPDEYLGFADDLFVAVLSEDGQTMSNSVPVRSTVPIVTPDYTSILGTDQRLITNVQGVVVWNDGEQEIELEGIRLEPGAEVFFEAGGRRETVSASAAAAPLAAAAATAAASVPKQKIKVKVPKSFTDWPDNCFVLETDDATKLAASKAPKCVGAQPPAEIPLGGRLRFTAYSVDGDDSRIYIMPEPDPHVGMRVRPAPAAKPLADAASSPIIEPGKKARQIKPQFVSMSLVAPAPVKNPFDSATVMLDKIPSVERELNPWDPDSPHVFYLRGIRIFDAKDPAQKVKVTAEYQDPSTGTTRTGELEVTVVKSTAGPVEGTPEAEAAIMNAAAVSGIPPQFLKAQVAQESRFDPELYRYEPVTGDLRFIGGNVQLERDNKEWGGFVKRHMFAGEAVRPMPAGKARKCVAVAGPKTMPPAADIAGCGDPLDGSTAHETPLEIAGDDVFIHSRVGLPGDAGYRAKDVTAVRHEIGDPAKSKALGLIQVHYWRQINEKVIVRDPVGDDDFRMDYLDNEVLFGRALAEGEWVKITYREVEQETIPAGACTVFDVTKLKSVLADGKTTVTYRQDETINQWMMANMARIGGRFLNAARENQIEFKAVLPRVTVLGRRKGVLDTRLKLMKGQFLASGSFGLVQATLLDLMTPKKPTVLNGVFDHGARCLHELRNAPNKERDALLLGAASHSWNKAKQKGVGKKCGGGLCDQTTFAEYWSRVISYYNRGGEGYSFGPLTTIGIVRRGIDEYDAK